MLDKDSKFKIGDETKEFRINENNLSEEQDYKELLKKIYNSKPNKYNKKNIKIGNSKLSYNQKIFSLLTYNVIYNMGKEGNYWEISSAIYALCPLIRKVFNNQQGKDEWFSRDFLFNAVPGTIALTNLFDYINENISSSKIENYHEMLRGDNAVEHAIGLAIARTKLDWKYPNVIKGKIYVYIKIEQLLSGNVFESLKVLSRNKIKNFTFIITANEYVSKELYEKALKILEFNGILYKESKKVESILTSFKKTNQLSALIIKTKQAFDTHWERTNFDKNKKITKSDISYLKNHYGFSDIDLNDIKSFEILSDFQKDSRKRSFNNQISWAETIDGKNRNKIISNLNTNWNIPNKTELLKLVKSSSKVNLYWITDKLINNLKEKNSELIINNTPNTIAANISNGISGFGLRSIIKSDLINSETLLPQLRLSKIHHQKPIIILKYNRAKLDGLVISNIMNSWMNSFENVFNPSNHNELIDSWLISLRNSKEISIIIIDEERINNNILKSSETFGKLSDGGYILKKRLRASKPIDYIFYGSGTIINEIREVAKQLEKEGKLNIQVVSVPCMQKMNAKTKSRILPSTIKKVEFISTGEVKNSHLTLINTKYAKALVTPEVWRSKNYIKEIRKILGK